MKKLCEIDSVEIYAKVGKRPFSNPWARKRKVNPDWVSAALNNAQQTFLLDKKYVLRPHPKHSPTLELFVDPFTVSDCEWSMAHLLFTKAQ